MTCNSPVEVFLLAAGVLFSAKATFLDVLGHVIALLKSSYVPQAFFFRQAVTHKWLWLYLRWERTYESLFPERTSIHKWLWLRLGSFVMQWIIPQ